MTPYLYYGVICLHGFCNNFIVQLNFFVTPLFVTCSWGQEGVHKKYTRGGGRVVLKVGVQRKDYF
jgi:hypothetical protein